MRITFFLVLFIASYLYKIHPIFKLNKITHPFLCDLSRKEIFLKYIIKKKKNEEEEEKIEE